MVRRVVEVSRGVCGGNCSREVFGKTCGRRKEGELARLYRKLPDRGQCTDFRPVDNTNTRLIFR